MRNVVVVENGNFVSVKNSSLKFRNLITKESHFLPFDEVEILLFINQNSSLSNRVIQQCLNKNIAILFCDEKQKPTTQILSEYGHSQRLKRLKSQLKLTTRAKDRMWRKIIMAKIINQGNCLKYTMEESDTGDFLREQSKTVTEGDRHNIEAVAAKRYFQAAFGKSFKRGRYNDIVNSGLNYGYALIRSVIRKELAIHGFEPSLGIHHVSTENPYNLADDLIEPYRPFVDALVYDQLFIPEREVLNLEEKKLILEIFFEKCVVDGAVMTLTDGIRLTVQSLIPCMENNSASSLVLPYFIEEGK